MKGKDVCVGIVALMFLSSLFLELHRVKSASPIYVRTDGSDLLCDGTINAPWSGVPTPQSCAVRTIQKGITTVEVGGTVFVSQGYYKETLSDITKSVHLRSLSGPNLTTLEGDLRGYVILVRDTSNVTIEGFTITNPSWTGGSDPSGIVVAAYTVPVSDVHGIRITNSIIHHVCAPTNNVVFGAVGINIGPSDGIEVDHIRHTPWQCRQLVGKRDFCMGDK